MSQRSAADKAIVSGSIRTLDPERSHATAVAFRDGTIAAVGSDAEVRAACDGATEIVDGRGMAVVPGIVDGHIHPFWPDHVAGADLTRCATLAELRAALASERERSDGGWVRGWGVDYGVFRDTGISGELLDQAVGGEPAVITIMDQHTALATPRALELAGVSGRAGRSGGERRGSPARSAQRHASQCGVRA